MYQANIRYLLRDMCSKQIRRHINNYTRFENRNANSSCSILQNSHYKPLHFNNRLIDNSLNKNPVIISRFYSDKLSNNSDIPNSVKISEGAILSNAEKLKKAVKEYGSTVIVFHIGISLISLGLCYVLVSSGVDLTVIFDKLQLSNEKINKLAGSTGTFVIAYAVHKVFAPVRLGITLMATPFIVRHLRSIGWLKK